MLLITITAIISAITSYILYVKFTEITEYEAIGIFSISFILSILLLFVATFYSLKDTKIISGYITSKVYRESYKYQEDYTYSCNCTTHKSGKSTYTTCQTCHGTHYYTEPEKFYIYQNKFNVKDLLINNIINRDFPIKGDRLDQSKKPLETCYGMCNFDASDSSNLGIDIDSNKFNKSKINETIVWSEEFDNYIKNTNLVFNNISDNEKILEYPEIFDINKIDRSGKGLNDQQLNKLNALNSELSNTNINIGIYFTDKDNGYEKLLREWKGGKINDFWIIVNNNNIDILGWDNFDIKAKLKIDIESLSNINPDSILGLLEKDKKILSGFKEKDLSNYSYITAELSIVTIILLFILNLIIISGTSYIMFRNNLTKNEYSNYGDYGSY